MKQFIRNETFETNSSSMHSLVVTKDALKYKKDELNFDYDSETQEPFNLFNWEECNYERFPFQVLRTPIYKLRYYVGWYLGFKNDKKKEKEIKEFLSNHLGLSKRKINIKYNTDECRHNGYQYPVVYPNDTGEDVFECLEKHNVSMEEFVLNPRYTVIIDGDEYQEFKALFDQNLINLDNIDYISSGKDFWDNSVYNLSMYFIQELSKENEWQYDELVNNIIPDISCDKHFKKLIIEDFRWNTYKPDKKSLHILADALVTTKATRTEPLQIVLRLYNNEKEDFKSILKYVDDIEQGKSDED